MSCLLSETILSVNEIKLFVADKNNKLHSGSEICPLRLDKGGKRNISKVTCCMHGRRGATCLPPLYKDPSVLPSSASQQALAKIIREQGVRLL